MAMGWSRYRDVNPVPTSPLADDITTASSGSVDRRNICINILLYRPTRDKMVDSKEGRKEMFYLTTHSTHFIYGYMASDIRLRTILIMRKETCCRHMGYSFRLTARVLLYAPSHRQDSTYHGLCYTSRGALAGTRNRLFVQYACCF